MNAKLRKSVFSSRMSPSYRVSSHSINGDNLGTFVMEKQKDGWLTVSFTNVIPHDPPWKK
jgi:hypothetical protein